MPIQFSDFLQESLEARNKAVDIEGTVKDALQVYIKRGSKISDEQIKAIADYMKDKKTFSMGKMSDYFYETDLGIMDGWIKAAIDAVKKEINLKGFGKNGTSTKTGVSQAERIDRYLKQKPTPRR